MARPDRHVGLIAFVPGSRILINLALVHLIVARPRSGVSRRHYYFNFRCIGGKALSLPSSASYCFL